MPVMPNCLYTPVVSGNYPKISRYDIVCIHTIVGYATGGSAAHFTTDSQGNKRQWRDTIFRSIANYTGNYRIIAIENEDHGLAYGQWNTNDGHAVPPFTAKQCEGIAEILVWCYRTHGIPLVLCPDSKPTSRGIAYHRQGIDGNFSSYDFGGRIPGGEIWTQWFGKVCPGDPRIHQLIDVIIPRARILVGLDRPPVVIPPQPPPIEDDMFSDEDRVILKEIRQTSLTNQNKLTEISRAVDRLFGLQTVEEIKAELHKMKRDILHSHNNRATWDMCSSLTWDEMSQYRWNELPILTP